MVGCALLPILHHKLLLLENWKCELKREELSVSKKSCKNKTYSSHLIIDRALIFILNNINFNQSNCATRVEVLNSWEEVL